MDFRWTPRLVLLFYEGMESRNKQACSAVLCACQARVCVESKYVHLTFVVAIEHRLFRGEGLLVRWRPTACSARHSSNGMVYRFRCCADETDAKKACFGGYEHFLSKYSEN